MRRSVLILSLLSFAAGSHAAIWQWPGTGAPCNSHLQACIDGVAAGDTIELATATPISPDDGLHFRIEKSLTLRNAIGVSPQLAPYVSLQATNTGATGPVRIVIEGIHLPNGRVIALQTVDQPLEFVARRLRIENPVNQNSAITLSRTVVGATAPVRGLIEDNDILTEGRQVFGTIYGAQAVSLSGGLDPGPLEIDVAYNRVRAFDTGQVSIMELITPGDTGWARFHANRIEGRNFNTGIDVYAGSHAGTAFPVIIANNAITGQNGNVGSPAGIAVHASEGHLRADITNNTVIRGRNGILISARTDLGGLVQGVVVNNLVAYNRNRGIGIESELEASAPVPAGEAAPRGGSGIFNANNLVHGNGFDEFTPGSGTLTANPRLEYASFRLRPDSPARNSGHANAPLVLASQGIPMLDVDGLRRVKDAAVDIGAHEAGARSHLHVAGTANISGNQTLLEWDAINANPGAHFIATPNWNPAGGGGVYNNHYTGLYITGSGSALRWRIYNESLAAMPDGAAFNLFLPDAGSGSGHLTSAANITGTYTVLSNPELDASASLLVHARHHWNGYGSPNMYFDRPFFVGHFDEAWLLMAGNGTMPAGVGFTLTMQERSPNAFFHTSRNGNRAGNWSAIDHPQLNGKPCAQLSVTPALLANNPHPIGVWYTGTHHAIYNQDMATMPEHANFHVSFDPAQLEACSRSQLFADGFED